MRDVARRKPLRRGQIVCYEPHELHASGFIVRGIYQGRSPWRPYALVLRGGACELVDRARLFRCREDALNAAG